MTVLIENYQNFPGEHCGSSAMRGLLKHYAGLELSEPAVFGLAGSLDSSFFSIDGLRPAIQLFGRTGDLEARLADFLQIDYREQPEEDDDHAWEVVRQEVREGRPTMLSGDILYLDYREYKVNFPGHRFVLLGYDDEDEKALIADRIRPEVERCSYGALRTSRNPPNVMSTHNLWGRFHGTEIGRDLRQAARLSIESCAEFMLTGTSSDFLPTAERGVKGTRTFAESLAGWGQRDDAQELAAFNARCLEKFGNGGGNFRRLYAGFLEWARGLDEALVPADAAARMTGAADRWTRLSETLLEASKEPRDELWSKASAQAHEIANLEEELFRALRGG